MAQRKSRREGLNTSSRGLQQPQEPNSSFANRSNHARTTTTAAADEETKSSISDAASMRQQQQQQPRKLSESPSLEPYVGKLERFELFSTNQCYYLIGCDKLNTTYRILKMDRTLIEGPPDDLLLPSTTNNTSSHHVNTPRSNTSAHSPDHNNNNSSSSSNPDAVHHQQQQALEATHNCKPTLRPLSEFLTEDPHVYSQEEIADLLDTIHEGNRLMRADHNVRSATASPDGNNYHHGANIHNTSNSSNHAGGAGSSTGGVGGGGLKPIVRAYGIVGFVRFLDCYYLTLITRRAKVGNIGGNGIFTIKDTETFPLKPAVRAQGLATDPDYHTDPSSMLLSMWNRGKRSVGLGLTNREIAELRYQGLYQVVDLTKSFFFSYTFDLTRSLQENFLASVSQPFPPPPFKDMYAWNFFLTREFEACTSTLTSHYWIMPIIHGAYVQRKIYDYGRSLNIILIARRSRHFAGTRYLKRGVSEQGKVANDVEHEQILHDESGSPGGNFASYLQMRGSIPIFWSQESSVTVPKPPIELNRVDPTYRSSQWHFEDMMKRYGSPIVVLDLVKQSEKREREVRVGDEFRHAIEYINTSIDDAHKIRYCALDYSHISKHRNLDVSTTLNEVSTWAVNLTGFFCAQPKWKLMKGGSVEPFDEDDTRGAKFLTEKLGVPVFPMEQKGVLRTNCIDCLDRTNVAQFSAGVEALEQQLVVMGIRSSANLDPSSTIVRALIDMYVEIGDFIALQYGGSEAHKKVSTERSESNIAGPMGKHKELLTSIRRYYSNTFTDRLKQDAMNLFLGYYVPYRHTIPLWEMENDYYLHNFHVKAGRGTFHSMRTYQHQFGIEWIDDDEQDQESQRPLKGSPGSGSSWRKSSGSSNRTSAVEQRESQRIARLRKQCDLQNQALSVWWKVAIQNNIQQRMWMQLGRGPSESTLPPRYERIYQPDKLTQFDRLFARSWVTPVRRTHTAQHSSISDDGTDATEYRRTINRTNSSPLKNKRVGTDQESDQHTVGDQQCKDETTLESFALNYGFEPRVAPKLQAFLKPFDIDDEKKGEDAEGNPVAYPSSRPFVGRLGQSHNPIPEEYVRYANSLDFSGSFSRFRPEAVSEFTRCLHESTLNSDDVGGIRELARSAHIGRKITSGPYRGLSASESAIEIATIAQEQLNALNSMESRGELRDAFPMVETELRRRGVYNPGVKHEVEAAWDIYAKSEKIYSEVFEPLDLSCRRSDLTTADSLRLYASFFDDDTSLFTPHQDFLLGDKSVSRSASIASGSSRGPTASATTTTGATNGGTTTSFVKKAARVGYNIPSYQDICKSKAPPLFPLEHRRQVPAGFEQINEDLFARKDNKYVVFNGAAIDSWTGSKPVTKLSSMEEDFLLSVLR